jgi:hypothetical protein
MEIWQIALVVLVLFLLINFAFKTLKFLFKLSLTLIIAGIIYYLLK